LVGDAAAILDPASSHGVLKAIRSGMMVGYLIGQAIAQGRPELLVLKTYQDWLVHQFTQDLIQLRDLYGLLP
jgi:flavin-dependent dehydrogenase